MKDFTNNNYNVNEFAYKDEARIRHISLKGLVIILVIAFAVFGSIAEELDFEFGKSHYTIYEIEEMAEEFWEDAEDLGYSKYRREDYAIDKLEDMGVEVERYNITFDYWGDAEVEAK
ncbi:MAG: hypothetical protein IKL08_06400 [Clostridia bacterium]|nr:hypothetical protein [Clostridia bacterium]